MNRVLRDTNTRSSALEEFNLRDLPDGRRQPEAENLFLLATPESGHQQDAGGDSFLTQRDGFIKRSDAEPGSALLLERRRALDRAVTVCIGFDDGAHCYAGADVFRDSPKILP